MGSLRDLSKNILKHLKAKVVNSGEGVLKVSPTLPHPRKILIIHMQSAVNPSLEVF